MLIARTLILRGICLLIFSWGFAHPAAYAGQPEIGQVATTPSSCHCGQCRVVESRHFRIHHCASESEASELAADCEKYLANFQNQWFGKTDSDWGIRCEIVVHSDVSAYRALLGPGSERTSGCSTISIDHGRVTQRRIDLRKDAADWKVESLPHEITHVALADRFANARIPAWADEGIAMLAESPGKLQARLIELRRLHRQGFSIGPGKLVDLRTGPAPGMQGVFYGESVLLAGFLLRKGSPEQMLAFVELGERNGYSSALQTIYGVASWGDLEAEWRPYAASDRVRELSGHQIRDRAME